MARYERVAEIFELLNGTREPLSMTSLCSSLGASRATVKRLLSFLRDDLLVAVRFDRVAAGYVIDRNADAPRSVVGPVYGSRELSALLMAHEILEQIPPGLFRRETAALRTRLQALLYKRPTGRHVLRKRVRLMLPQSRAVDEALFRTVLAALDAQKRLRICYKSRSRDADSTRTVSPQRLTFYRSNWYLAAWCHRNNDLRVFSIDRISQAELTPIPADEMPEKALEARISTGYGIFEGEANQVAILRFSPDAARWVGDEQWHPNQRIEIQGDGQLVLRVPYRHATELQMDILRHGAGVEVLAPDSLRRQVAAAHEEAAKQYRGSTDAAAAVAPKG
jgi:predicted DNA-binding transcriptional regulator YafY